MKLVLHLELRYDVVLPESVVSQFIVRRHLDARNPGEWWRDGIALKRGTCEALVRAHATEQEAKIELRLRGERAERREMLASIRETLRDPKDATPPVLYIVLGRDCAHSYNELLIHSEKVREMPFIIDGKSVMRELAPILDLIQPPNEQNARGGGTHIYNPMIIDQSTKIGRDNLGQAGHTLTNCTNMIQQQSSGEVRSLLEKLAEDVEALLAKLPEDKQEEAVGNLELITKAATSAKPNRAWYSVSSEGLLEASKFVKNFTGNIAGTIKSLGKALFPAE